MIEPYSLTKVQAFALATIIGAHRPVSLSQLAHVLDVPARERHAVLMRILNPLMVRKLIFRCDPPVCAQGDVEYVASRREVYFRSPRTDLPRIRIVKRGRKSDLDLDVAFQRVKLVVFRHGEQGVMTMLDYPDDVLTAAERVLNWSHDDTNSKHQPEADHRAGGSEPGDVPGVVGSDDVLVEPADQAEENPR